MGKYNAHERALIRRLEEQNELLTEQLKEQKDANLKLEDIKDILVMMLDKRQFLSLNPTDAAHDPKARDPRGRTLAIKKKQLYG